MLMSIFCFFAILSSFHFVLFNFWTYLHIFSDGLCSHLCILPTLFVTENINLPVITVNIRPPNFNTFYSIPNIYVNYLLCLIKNNYIGCPQKTY